MCTFDQFSQQLYGCHSASSTDGIASFFVHEMLISSSTVRLPAVDQGRQPNSSGKYLSLVLCGRSNQASAPSDIEAA
ncbi:hypothetical protein MUK42_00003 [Musa troglodytarum]|uniref:Uncharacterized protein n=1 Tax=Musa troglodytarum TaxID=320322 RepID=A0A9E7FE16_9LILI|nr:hypothetical protein MUK42_00003 [Musa troglodytarum]